uniref:Ensconsin n=1 Tax=Electrophorus electricus TaxID=8005 RepID=A0AAY5EBI6_ELEEL
MITPYKLPTAITSCPNESHIMALRFSEPHALKVDERLRLARKRREEHLKQRASRERGWLAREERARRCYEQHLEERRKKLEEHRQREERRRMAVENKRRQRLKEERERYESVVRRTTERSQKAKQRVVNCSQRGGSGARSNTNGKYLMHFSANENSLLGSLHFPSFVLGSMLSVSVLCSSLAKRRLLSQWEVDLVSRLQTPTISYLARSRSAVCLSKGEVTVLTAVCLLFSLLVFTPYHFCFLSLGCLHPNLFIPQFFYTPFKPKTDFPMVQRFMCVDVQLHATLALIRAPLRQAPPKPEALPPLLEEEDPEPDCLLRPPQHQPHLSAALCLGELVLLKPGPAGPPFSPACPQTARGEGKNKNSPFTFCHFVHAAKNPKGGSSAGTTDPERASRKESDEEEARQRVIAEQPRLERERRFQREEAERQERKKVWQPWPHIGESRSAMLCTENDSCSHWPPENRPVLYPGKKKRKDDWACLI